MAGSSGSIRGITIQIGGDTSRLGEALDDVSKRSREAGTGLASVERSLKLNPDSVVLLGQKMRRRRFRYETCLRSQFCKCSLSCRCCLRLEGPHTIRRLWTTWQSRR